MNLQFFLVVFSLFVCTALLLRRTTDLLAEPNIVPMGEEAKIAPFVFAVQSVDTRTQIGTGILARPPEGVYKIVTIIVRNDDDMRHAITEQRMSIMDAAGVEYFPVCRTDLGSCIEVPDTFISRLISPYEEVLGVFVFDVPREATGFRLKILRDPFRGTYTLFDLD